MANIFAVWGNSGSGKSLISCAIADRLTGKEHSVIVISTDKVTPMMRTYLPMYEDSADNSIGKLLSGSITADSLKGKIQLHPQNNNIGFMSLGSYDNGLIFQESWSAEVFSKLTAVIFQLQLCDYLLFDCSPDIFADAGMLFALERAQAVVRVMSPDNRGISFAEAQAPVLRGGDFRYDEHIMVLNNFYPYSPVGQLNKDWHYNYNIPHCPSAHDKYLSGSLIHRLRDESGYLFEDAITKITESMVKSIGNS